MGKPLLSTNFCSDVKYNLKGFLGFLNTPTHKAYPQPLYCCNSHICIFDHTLRITLLLLLEDPWLFKIYTLKQKIARVTHLLKNNQFILHSDALNHLCWFSPHTFQFFSICLAMQQPKLDTVFQVKSDLQCRAGLSLPLILALYF